MNFSFPVSLSVPPEVRLHPSLASGHHPGHLQMQGSLEINSNQRFFNQFLFAEVCWISGRQGRWSDKSWLEDVLRKTKWQFIVIASIPRLHHPKYTSLIALHWRLADTRKYWKILLPAASTSDGNLWCCPPHSLIAFLLPPDIQSSTAWKQTKMGLAFLGTTFQLTLDTQTQLSVFCTPQIKHQYLELKSFAVTFWNLSAVKTQLNCIWSTFWWVGQCTWHLIWH